MPATMRHRTAFCLTALLFSIAFLTSSRGFAGPNDARPPKPQRAVRIIVHAKDVPPAKHRVEVIGLSNMRLQKLRTDKRSDEEWQKLLRVTVAPGMNRKTADLPAMLGDYSLVKDRLVFTPRFPFRPGVSYRAVFAGGGTKDDAVVHLFSLPRPKPKRTPKVTQVFPTASVLPENLLKFYVHFSVPMSRGEAYRRISLLDGKGRKIPNPFLELGEELWDPSGRRFTLFFDPGRIKRGLKPREDVGPALEQGKSYTLVIDRRWTTASGHSLKATFRKPFRVGPPDEKQPDHKRWKLRPPAAGTRKPLTVQFPESLDHAMLNRVLTVHEAKSSRTATGGLGRSGTITVDRNERRWRFTPKSNWPAGNYVLRIATSLEDLAGNSIGRPFEVDLKSKRPRKPSAKTVELPFRVSAK